MPAEGAKTASRFSGRGVRFSTFRILGCYSWRRPAPPSWHTIAIHHSSTNHASIRLYMSLPPLIHRPSDAVRCGAVGGGSADKRAPRVSPEAMVEVSRARRPRDVLGKQYTYDGWQYTVTSCGPQRARLKAATGRTTQLQSADVMRLFPDRVTENVGGEGGADAGGWREDEDEDLEEERRRRRRMRRRRRRSHRGGRAWRSRSRP